MIRVWFNHWFSTVYHIIDLIRESEPNCFWIVGSNTNPYALYRQTCDEWYDEPDIVKEEEYVQFALDFCEKHQIDVFIPRKLLPAIALHHADFASIGTRVLCDLNGEIMRLLDHKSDTYSFLSARGFDCIPPYRVACSLDEFKKAVDTIGAHAERVCYKLVQDEGALSFRIIDERVTGIRGLREKPGFKLTRKQAESVMSGYDFAIPVLVMPYLDGDEISVDCLHTLDGDIILPRYKTGKRYSVIRFENEIIDECKRLISELDLNYPCNVQFRCWHDKYWLLEINPRMSGGIQLSCLASGVNLPGIAIHRLLGDEMPWQIKTSTQGIRVANLETPILLN